MKENMKDTIRIDAKNVDREVGEAFKSYVFKKHGKIRGAFSEEVTAALKEYLQRYDSDEQKEDIDTELLSLNEEATKWFLGRVKQIREEEKRSAHLRARE
jgi:hypothetical protein